MKKEVIDRILEKKPKLSDFRKKLESMEPGTYCIHRSWGFGQIKDYDEANNKLIIDFSDRKDHPMDPVFCLDKLDILDQDNILVRHQQDPDSIENLIKKHPTDIIVEILKKTADQSATASEIESMLKVLLGESKYRKWWTATKKLLIKDPRIAVPNKKTAPYVLREDPLSAEQEILEEFYLNKNPKKKILLAEKLHLLSGSVEEIEQDLPQILEALTQAIQEATQLTQAERLQGCWIRNDLARHLHTNVDDLEPTSNSFIENAESLSELAEELPSSYHKRFLDLITRVYPESWEDTCIQLLRTSVGKFTHECICFLIDRDCTDTVAYNIKKWLDEQTIKGPVLHWAVKNRQSKRFQPIIEDLIGYRLLSAIFSAIDNEALMSTSNRRNPLVDSVCDDPDLIRDLLHNSTQETATDLAQTLLLNQGFEDLSKKSVLARFIKIYPSIQSLVSGEAESHTEQLFVSKESMETKKKEYELLINEKIPQNKEAIAIAREHGDLRENAEYKMARQDQDTLLAHKAQMETDLARARVTDFSEASKDIISIGSVVELREGSTGKMHTYAILGAWDSKPEENILSYKTPLAQSLLSKQKGDTVTTEIDNTEETWTVESIKRWVDLKK